MAMYSPLEGDNWGECVIQQGHPAPGPNAHCGSTWDRVSTHFLDSIGVPIVRGRDFTDQDTATSPQVAIVNQDIREEVLSRTRIRSASTSASICPQYSGAFEIVGVFADFKMNQPGSPVRPVYLRPLTQHFTGYKEPEMITTESQSMIMNAMIIQFNQPQQNVDTLIRRTLAGIDPNLTIMDLRTFEAQVAGNFNQDRLHRAAHEPVRHARAHSRFGRPLWRDVLLRRPPHQRDRHSHGPWRDALQRSLHGHARCASGRFVIGLVLGIPCALYAGHLMKSMLYEVASYDALALAGAPLMLVLCAAIAGFIPARRAASIEPMQALRTE